MLPAQSLHRNNLPKRIIFVQVQKQMQLHSLTYKISYTFTYCVTYTPIYVLFNKKYYIILYIVANSSDYNNAKTRTARVTDISKTFHIKEDLAVLCC